MVVRPEGTIGNGNASRIWKGDVFQLSVIESASLRGAFLLGPDGFYKFCSAEVADDDVEDTHFLSLRLSSSSSVTLPG